MSKKRSVDLSIISDTHLGTYGSHADELYSYLKSIKPKTLVLNGDIIDMWQFKKRYFPPSHTAVLRQICKMIEKGTKIYYITGNHDDHLRHYSPFQLHSFELVDKLILEVGGEKVWVFHGDVFDRSIQQARWVAKLGGHGYDLLIKINRLINRWLVYTGRQPISLSQKIKANIKNAVKYISDFEQVAIELAIDQGYDRVVCGHIHHAIIRDYENDRGKTVYMNSGDWVESLTALEYSDSNWSIYKHDYRPVPKSRAPKPSLINNRKAELPAEMMALLSLHTP